MKQMLKIFFMCALFGQMQGSDADPDVALANAIKEY